MKKGMVYIIGAGCGSRDYITLRGLKCLRDCEAAVYDDLIDEALLEELQEGSELIYMGKRRGRHSSPQEEINKTLIRLASDGKTVARLKGGDPFVFGRGGEEVLALAKAGIDCEIIPGISSALAIPAAAGIPLTHRGLSRSFHVITAHTAGGGLPEGLEELAKITGTLIFLMGLGKIKELSEALIQEGKPGDTPAAVISGGNSPNPALVRGRLSDIASLSLKAEVKAPAIIVVGATAAMELNKAYRPRPLEGLRVGLTGTDSFRKKLAEKLRDKGALPYTAQRLEIIEHSGNFEPGELCDGRERWLIFTSANGVRIFLKQLKERHIDLRRLTKCSFAVIGRSTAAVLEENGIYPELCPEVFTSETLAEALCEKLRPGQEAILLRAENGAEILPRKLREAGIKVRDIALYSLEAAPEKEGRPERAAGPDYLCFGSAGGLRLYMDEHGKIPESTRCVCIGAVTAEALKRVYDKPFLTANSADADSMVQAITEDRKK